MSSDREDLSGVVCFVLAGGTGERLRPLTLSTPKPLLMYGGVYRLLDFTLSNVSNSGLDRAYVLTQYRKDDISAYLRGHWNDPSRQRTGVVHQPPVGGKRYRGTADAVAANLERVAQDAELILVLSADHVYRMDYRPLIEQHRRVNPGVTLAAFPVPPAQASQLGIVTADGGGRIVDFVEKPSSPPAVGPEGQLLGSMGVYVFDRQAFEIAVAELDGAGAALDFGRDVLPYLVSHGEAQAFSLETGIGSGAYWRDLGTVDAYRASNLDLLRGGLYGSLLDEQWPIRPSFRTTGEDDGALRPGSSPWRGSVVASPVPRSCAIEDSIVGPAVAIGENADVCGSILLPGARVGCGARVRNAVLDACASVEAGDEVGYGSSDRNRFEVTDSGVVIVGSDSRERTLGGPSPWTSDESSPMTALVAGLEGHLS